MTDLVERLKRWSPMDGGRRINPDGPEAAAEIERLREVVACFGADPEDDTWWKTVIGGEHQPSGEIASIRHMHPLMVKPFYDQHKGTAIGDIIAGLIFGAAITRNRERFLVNDANERRDRAEAEVERLTAALSKASGEGV